MYKENALPVSVDRWRIVGRIETLSPLHIGDGYSSLISKRNCNRQSLDGADPSYATVHIGYNGKPVIPATSLKGALRAWAEANRLDSGLVKEVFGYQDRGGTITFHDAPLDQPSSPADTTARFWCNERATALSPRVVIDSVARSAAERLLFYVEYVPEGATFRLAITGRNATARQRSLLLYVLQNAFRDGTRPARLGSQVANGWGKVSWSRTGLETLNVASWLAAPPEMWHKALRPVDAATEVNWLALAKFETKPQGRIVRLGLTLTFDGPMVVNDPTRCKKGDQNGRDAVGHAMIRRENGQVFLPSASVRGAFRAQARRIWQTLAWSNPDQNASTTPNTNGRHSGSQSRLAAFFKVFGATGWRAPLEVGDFELRGAEDPVVQEFVAVDRFTGGAAKKKLFNAHALWKPTFAGDVIIRADRWEKKEWDVRPWVWLLLAFTLRDWIEGDGFIGFGRSKGYGGFRAGCEVTGSGREVDLLRGVLGRDSVALASPELAQWGQSLKEAINAKEAA